MFGLMPGGIAVAAGQPSAGTPTPRPHERLIGLLNLSDVLSLPCGPDQPVSVDLFARPSSKEPAIGSLTFRVTNRDATGESCDGGILLVRDARGGVEELPTRESGYEVPAAIVYQRSGSWYRIATSDGSAWIKRTKPDDFLPYPALLHDMGAHLMDGWGSRLWRTPGAGRGQLIPKAWQHLEDDTERIEVEILGDRRVAGQLWLHVQFARSDTCGELVPADLPEVSGWIPAYRPSDGDPNLWFYSRGC